MATISLNASSGTFTPNCGDILDAGAQGNLAYKGDADFVVQLSDSDPCEQVLFEKPAASIKHDRFMTFGVCKASAAQTLEVL